MKTVLADERDSGKRPRVRSSYRLALVIAGTLLLLLLCGLDLRPTVAVQPRATDQAGIEVKQSVGENAGICAPTSTSVIAVTTGKSVYYCITLRNSGTVPLSRHTFSVVNAVINKRTTFTQTLAPGQEFQLTSNILTSLGADGTILSQLVNGAVGTVLTNTVTITSTNAQADIATGQARARVVVGSVGLKVTKTVGLNDSCSTTKGLAVEANTTVKYCITLQNTGTLTLTNHRVSDPLLNVDVTFPLAFPVGATLVITDGALRKYDSNQDLTLAITRDLTNTVLVTSTTAEGVVVSGSAQAVAAVGKTSSILTYTVGLADGCATTSTAMPFISGSKVYYCLKLTNNGTVPLESHTVRWVQNAAVNTTITQTVQAGQSLLITQSRISQLAPVVAATTNNEFTVTSANHRGMVTTATAKGTVTVGPQTLAVVKYAPLDRNSCVSSLPLNIVAGQEFYYCVVLTNTGQVPLVRFAFVETAPINISGIFTYTLLPGQKITLTNQFLNSVGLPSLLGPFKVTSGYFGTFNVSATSANNITAYQSNAVQVNISVPTATPTVPPTAQPTFTPSLTPIPIPSPTLPPTPTPSPVVVSFQPTPTQPFSVNSVTTPTPGVLAGVVPPAVDQFGQPIQPAVDQFGQPISPLVDQFGQPIQPAVDQFGQPISPLAGQPAVDFASTAFALTVEAAATQTAMAFIPPPIIDTPIAPLVETPVTAPVATPMATGIITPTATPLLPVLTPLPTPEVENGYLAVVTRVFQVSTATLGWLWFAIGSIVFFATAGMFAGLSWRYRNQQGVYEMNARSTPADEGMHLEASETQAFSIQSPAVPSSGKSSPDDEDYWPPSLR